MFLMCWYYVNIFWGARDDLTVANAYYNIVARLHIERILFFTHII